MEGIALSLGKSLLQFTLRSAVRAGAQTIGLEQSASPIRKTADGLLGALTQDDLTAWVDSVFGDQFARQLLQIQKTLDKAVSDVQNTMSEAILGQAVLQEYREIQRCIHGPQYELVRWLTNMGTSMEPQLREEFRRAYLQDDLPRRLRWLHQRIIHKDVTGLSLLDEIANICKDHWQQFSVWESHICPSLS